MAERRMMSKKVTDDDAFMALSSSAQALYLHLSMSADDDGFSNQVALSMFKAHASVQDLEALLEKRYIYQFDNGVIVIKHWRMANALRKDRYNATLFQEELSKLHLNENGIYDMADNGCQMVAKWLPQDSIGKDRLDKDSLDKGSLGSDEESPKKTKSKRQKFGEYEHVLLSENENKRLRSDYGDKIIDRYIKKCDEYCERTGKKYKNYNLTIRGWIEKEGIKKLSEQKFYYGEDEAL